MVQSVDNIDDVDARIHLAKLAVKKEIAKGTHEFTFELERKMEYRPGQYVWVELPRLAAADPRGARRAFSLASMPDQTNRFTIICRSTKSGFNASLRSLNVGDELNIIGPFGLSFCMPDDPSIPLVLIAGGTGVASFLSVIRYSASIKSPRNITLINANSSKEQEFYADEMAVYHDDSKPIKVINLTRKIKFSDIEGSVGLNRALIYVSGSQGFVDYIYALLKANGIFDHQLHFEQYYPSHTADQELYDLFENGKPKISLAEPEHIRKRSQLIYELVNSSASHTVVADSNARIIFANQAAQDITGYSISEMLGNTPRLWGGLMPEAFYRELWAIKINGGMFNSTVINRRKNGEIYIASIHISSIKNNNGEVIGFILSEEDITELRRSEQKAVENERRFIQLTEKISEVYWIFELVPQERVAYVSPLFEEIWGVPATQLYKNPRAWTDSIHPEDRQKVLSTFDLFLNGKSGFDMEYRIIRGDKREFVVRDQRERVTDKAGNIVRVVGVARDITKEKMVDKEKTEFVSLASHQLRTPIGAMRLYLEMLIKGDYGEIPPKPKELLQDMFVMNTRINELIESLLNVSRIEIGVFIVEPVAVDFIKLCEEALMEMAPRLVQKGHELVKEFDEKLPNVPADPKWLRIIFQNFISNAVKYTPDKGRIKISLKADDKNIYFSVANNGEPIPEAEQAKIFQKMFRASNAQKQDPGGNGLGLYLCKQITDNSGGRIWFTSKKGEDTVFAVSFPLSGMIRKESAK